jgi:predicted aspartyl protease
MGKTLAEVQVVNFQDMIDVESGRVSPADVRRLNGLQGLVDTDTTMFGMPAPMIRQLGLRKFHSRIARTAAGTKSFDIYGMAQISILGREARVEVMELPEGSPVLIGQIPLEMIDFLVDPINQRLIGNPEHDGQQMIEIFGVFD